MRRLLLAAIVLLGTFAPAAASEPLEIVVFLSAQRLIVLEDGRTTYEFDVSSGTRGHWTPPGVYKPQFLSRNHKSSIYGNAPMPNSIFFHGNYALHGTYESGKLGRPASHGCIRLSLENSKVLFRLVQEYGFDNTQIRVVG